MIITKDVLKNLKLKYCKISEKRCQEINAMKIKNLYYPLPFFTCKGEYFTILPLLLLLLRLNLLNNALITGV